MENCSNIIVIQGCLSQFDKFFFLNFEKQGITVYNHFIGKGRIFRFLAHVFSYLSFLNVEVLWGNWKRKIFNCELLIVFDEFTSIKSLNVINKNNPHIRKIFYLWNKYVGPVSRACEFAKSTGWEIWSFDYDDCVKYGFKYNHTFYPLENTFDKNKIKYDLLFVGYNKGRKEFLLEKNKQWKGIGLKPKIIIREWSKYGLLRVSHHEEGALITYRETPYNKILKMISESNCIIDITRESQSGFTIRVMESLAFHKKLITNNTFIKQTPVYHEDNVFILGLDDDKDLLEFLSKPYVHIDGIEQEYGINAWISRFLK